MSTFGKKALVWWNYHENDTLRFRHTHPDMQIQILRKWYPIGMHFIQKESKTNYIYRIIDYEYFNLMSMWQIKLELCEVIRDQQNIPLENANLPVWIKNIITRQPYSPSCKPIDHEVKKLKREKKN